MSTPKSAGGPTQDEIMAVSLFKLELCSTDTVLEIGCGTGKVSIAAAQQAKKVFSLDKRPEAIKVCTGISSKNHSAQHRIFLYGCCHVS